MKPEHVAQIAQNDQTIAAHIEAIKEIHDKKPLAFKRIMRRLATHIEEYGQMADQDGYRPAMLMARMAMIGNLILFEHFARWEAEAAEGK